MARNVKEIVEQVLDTLIPDESFTGDQVLELVNACALRISRKLVLPALDTTGTVTTLTSAAQVALPTNHQRNLYSCRDSSAPDDFVIIHNDRHEMIRAHGPSFDIKTGTKVL